jgi:hypothetical protein
MTVCKFSVIYENKNICALSNLIVNCVGWDEDIEDCPFWRPYVLEPNKRRKNAC